MKNRILSIVALLPLLAIAENSAPPAFAEADVNGDGGISPEEAAAIAAIDFAAADTDEDGLLSTHEYAAAAVDHRDTL